MTTKEKKGVINKETLPEKEGTTAQGKVKGAQSTESPAPVKRVYKRKKVVAATQSPKSQTVPATTTQPTQRTKQNKKDGPKVPRKRKPQDNSKRNMKKSIRFQTNLEGKQKIKRTKLIMKRKIQKNQDAVGVVTNGTVVKSIPVKKVKPKQAPKVGDKPKAIRKPRKAKVKVENPELEPTNKRKRTWDKRLQFDTTETPDNSLIIVHPRMGAKVRKVILVKRKPASEETAAQVPITNAETDQESLPSPAIPSSSASTPYLIQSMPNFSMANPPSNIPGEVLVTPTGIVLIKAVTSSAPPPPPSVCVENKDLDISEMAKPPAVIALPAPPAPDTSPVAPCSIPSLTLEEDTAGESAISVEVPTTVAEIPTNAVVLKTRKIDASARTKKYSRSLDTIKKQFLIKRRRSHPEPKVKTFVGNRQGKSLIDQLRQEAVLPSEPGNSRGNFKINSNNKTVPFLPLSVIPNTKVAASNCSNAVSSQKKNKLKVETEDKSVFLGALGLYTKEIVDAMREDIDIKRKEREEIQQQQFIHQQQQLDQPRRSALQPVNKSCSIINNSNSSYTGTLKTVIKIQRQEKRGHGKMIYKASSSSTSSNLLPNNSVLENGHASNEEATESMNDVDENSKEFESDTDVEDSNKSNGTLGAGGQAGGTGGKTAGPLVIPEKASSFSIHPHRICSDVCTYCFGKFGLFDTPCHIGQIKGADKRTKILSETHLTEDSCLCDACFRHVYKRSRNTVCKEPSSPRRKLLIDRKSRCALVDCKNEGYFSLSKNSLVKLKKVLDDNYTFDPHVLDRSYNSFIWICATHNSLFDYYLNCGICKKRLTGINMNQVASSVDEINNVLNLDGIPTSVTEKQFLCKLCQFYTHIRIRYNDPKDMNSSQRQYYDSCRKRILRGYNDTTTTTNPDVQEKPPSESNLETRNGKSCKLKKTGALVASKDSTHSNASTTEYSEGNNTTLDSPSKVNLKSNSNNNDTLSNGEELDLRAKIEMLPDLTPGGFHKCSTTIQFTTNTKNMFWELQRPYGNSSSFFTHLVNLEKHFRSGNLVISPNAEPGAAKYLEGVQNRIRSFEGKSSRPNNLVPKRDTSSTAPPLTPKSLTIKPVTISPLILTPLTITPIPPLNAQQNPLTDIEATVQNIGLNKPEISISSIPATSQSSSPSPPATTVVSPTITLIASSTASQKLTPRLEENLRFLAKKFVKFSPSTSIVPSNIATKAVILNRTIGGHKQRFVQVTTGGKTIHLTVQQFHRIQQMQLQKKREQEGKLRKLQQDQEPQQQQNQSGSPPSLVPLSKTLLRSIAAKPVTSQSDTEVEEKYNPLS